MARIETFRPDGTCADLLALGEDDIDFADVAGGLSRINRFDGKPKGPGYSVAQHSVIGADALFAETGDVTLSGYFLVHDGHETLLGDWSTPSFQVLQADAARLLAARHPRLKLDLAGLIAEARQQAKYRVDKLIWIKAGLPDLTIMPVYARQVHDMDVRMLSAEALALFGPRAAQHVPNMKALPRSLAAIKPWAAMKAEMAWLERLERYLGIVVRPA